ncbi:MAG: folate-binding protein [Chromatiaceae bacterium]|nr:MAG: folate-binding protein [Chromatiaceae bacterium]
MHPDWRAFLEAQGARIDADGAARFAPASAPAPTPASALGQGAPAGADALTDLSHLGIIRASGADAIKFLQGQVSNDLRELSATHSQLSSHCSAKGRMLAIFRMLRVGEDLLMVLPRVQMETLLKRLRMFVLRSEVSLADASDELVCLGLLLRAADNGAGQQAAGTVAVALAERFNPLPATANAMLQVGAASLIRVAGEQPRYLFVGPADSAQTLWEAVAGAGAERADADAWALADIRAGLPTVLPATSDTFVPQMANLHLVDGLSFHKGCYAGQEVVARMQYLGKLKRRMYMAEVECVQPPQPGDPLAAPGSQSEQVPGRIVDARPIGPGRYALLAVAEIAMAEGGELRLGEDGPVLALQPPPYGFPAEV